MFASKLTMVSLRIPLIGNSKSSLFKPNNSIVRLFKNSGRNVNRRGVPVKNELKSKFPSIQLSDSIGPIQVGEAALAGGAVLGLGALCYYGLGLSNETGAIDRMRIWPEYVRVRIRDSYMYFGASIATIAASSVAIFRSPFGPKFYQFCARRPIVSMIGGFACLIASSQAMRQIPYSPGFGSKQIMWLVNCSMIGLLVSPIAVLGGAIALRAAWYTVGVTGGLSAIAICAPSEKFLNWAGPLGIGLGGVIVASLGTAFLSPTTTLGLSLYSLSLYGGLLLFSAFLLYDTQKLMRKAEHHPPPNPYYNDPPFDPINASHGIVMDVVNIFIRLVQILSFGNMSKRK